MSTLFISDLHLEDNEPGRTEQLLAFLSGPASTAAQLYILGDLFEYWIGDDAPSPTAVRVAGALRALTDKGVGCSFLHGNRDFLLGEAYAGQAGITLLPETCVVDLYGSPTLLLHGDTLCTDDVKYQAFRQQVRNPAWQAQVLALSVEQRLAMAGEARDASMAHTGSTAMEIMDVNDKAVAETFQAHGVQRMIHGHTHRPAMHSVELADGIQAERIVLSDWYDGRASYLEVSADGLRDVSL